MPSMARFLIATYSAAGHVAPAEPIARELVARGHEVHWYTGAHHRDRVSATGAVFVEPRHAPDLDASELSERLPERARLNGIALLRYDVRNVFLAALPGQVADPRLGPDRIVRGTRDQHQFVDTDVGQSR